MIIRRKLCSALVAAVLPLSTLVLAAGCNKGGGSPPAISGPSGGPSVTSAGGEAIFKANGCGNCHNLGGQGRDKAPDLSHEGAEASKTAQWIADHIKNPKTHNPMSRMPAFEGKMSAQDIQSLANYLAGLK